MQLLLSASAAVLFFMLGFYFHDFQIDRRVEILLFGLAASSVLLFEWLLHR